MVCVRTQYYATTGEAPAPDVDTWVRMAQAGTSRSPCWRFG